MARPAAPEPAPSGADAARELGATVAAAREQAGLSIEDVAADTRIRGTVVRAIEKGEFALCGGHVYARGHLRAIAHAVGADATPWLAAYDELAGSPLDPGIPLAQPAPLPAAGATEADPRALRNLAGTDERRGVSGWLLAGVLAVLAIAIVAGVSLASSSGGKGATANSGATVRPPQTPTTRPPVTTSPPETVALAGVNVVVRVHDQPSWVHVADESGTVVFQGTLQQGTAKTFHATQRLSFVFGYAPAIDLTVNGRDIGAPPSNASQVASVSFDASGGANG